MTEKNIRMKRKKADGTFDIYYPETKAEIVKKGASNLGTLFDNHLAEAAISAHKISNIAGLGDALEDRVTASEVLTITNTTEYTPTDDYHPATKKYVDDHAGGGGSSTASMSVLFNYPVYIPNLLEDSIVALTHGNTFESQYSKAYSYIVGTYGGKVIILDSFYFEEEFSVTVSSKWITFVSCEGPTGIYASDGDVIYYSNDGGETFASSQTSFDNVWALFRNIAAVEYNNEFVIFRTLTGGQTWIPATNSPGDYVGCLGGTPDGSVLLAVEGGTGIYESLDGGDTWALTEAKDVNIDYLGIARIIVEEYNGDTIYYAVGAEETYNDAYEYMGVIYKRVNNGTWTKQLLDFAEMGLRDAYIHSIFRVGNSPSLFAVAEVYPDASSPVPPTTRTVMYYSSDNGNTWALSSYLPEEIESIISGPESHSINSAPAIKVVALSEGRVLYPHYIISGK